MKGDALLGIDIGTSRLRIAVARPGKTGFVTEAIGTRDLPSGTVIAGAVKEQDLLAASIEDLLTELEIRERTCVCAIGAPAATLRRSLFPRMTTFERMRAARFEVERERGSLEGIAVRVHAASSKQIRRVKRITGKQPEAYFVGAVASHVLTSRIRTLRKAGLRPIAVDFEGAALCDAFPEAHAIIDIGSERFCTHAIAQDGALLTQWSALGGDTITESIREDLAIDRATAESRKRILGTAGAGDRALQDLVHGITESLETIRRRKAIVERVVIVGNGSRLYGLHDALDRMSGISIIANRPEGLSSTVFSDDVVRTTRTDWSLAIALARWGSRS